MFVRTFFCFFSAAGGWLCPHSPACFLLFNLRAIPARVFCSLFECSYFVVFVLLERLLVGPHFASIAKNVTYKILAKQQIVAHYVLC